MHAGLAVERLVISDQEIKESYLGPEKTFMLDYDIIPTQKSGVHYEAEAGALNYGEPSDLASITDPSDKNDPSDPVMSETPIPRPLPTPSPDNSQKQGDTPQPMPSQQPTSTQQPVKTNGKKLVKGKTYIYKGLKYKITTLTKKGGTASLVTASKKSLKQAVIPSILHMNGYKLKVTAIGKNAFRNFRQLKRITIGRNIKKIGAGAFRRCVKLKKIQIQSRILTSVGKKAFSGIPQKASITVPKKMREKYKALI